MSQELQRISHKPARRKAKPANEQISDDISPEPGLLPPHEKVLRMQRKIGNRAVMRMLTASNSATRVVQRSWAGEFVGAFEDSASAALQHKKIVTIGTERVEVANDEEAKEAQRIIDTIQTKYGIQVSSPDSVEALKEHYSDAPDDVLNRVRSKTWKFKELKALERALAHFAPILGKNREQSFRKGEDQEITSVGKVHQSITKGKLDTTTLGEYFKSSKNFSMFTAGEKSTIDFPGDNEKQLEATAVHEIAHGLMKYLLPGYTAALSAYWQDASTALADGDGVANNPGAEAPITDYGTKNASEDLSEAVMMYFVDPDTLKKGKGKPKGTPGNPCPVRYQLIKDAVEKWTPPVIESPVLKKGQAFA